MEENAIALRVLIAAAKAQPHNAPALWQAARLILNGPVASLKSLKPAEKSQPSAHNDNGNSSKKASDFPVLQAEFDYQDEFGLHSHRTIYVTAMVDARDLKTNSYLPPADRFGYLLTGYCTMRKQIRSFRSSRISNLRTFTEGQPLKANRQWRALGKVG